MLACCQVQDRSISMKYTNTTVCNACPRCAGKSVYIQRYLLNLPGDSYTPPNIIGFSARTTANMTQYLIDAKLDRRRKGVFGPPVGKQSVIFVDDLNMPQLETYGAQPPIEILRQYMDHGGWYDR
jgi:dynein heavy chain, axonemal